MLLKFNLLYTFLVISIINVLQTRGNFKIFLLKSLKFQELLIHFSIYSVSCFVHMCWYANWAENREYMPFTIDNLDASLVNQIFFF